MKTAEQHNLEHGLPIPVGSSTVLPKSPSGPVTVLAILPGTEAELCRLVQEYVKWKTKFDSDLSGKTASSEYVRSILEPLQKAEQELLAMCVRLFSKSSLETIPNLTTRDEISAITMPFKSDASS